MPSRNNLATLLPFTALATLCCFLFLLTTFASQTPFSSFFSSQSQHKLTTTQSSVLRGKEEADAHTQSSELRLAHVFHQSSSQYRNALRRLDVEGEDVEDEVGGVGVNDVDGAGRRGAKKVTVRHKVGDVPVWVPEKELRQQQQQKTKQNVLIVNQHKDGDGSFVAKVPKSVRTARKRGGESRGNEFKVQGRRKKLRLPDPTDAETVRALGYMASNAYSDPAKGDWIELGPGWNTSIGFGWEEDGLRGYVFTDDKNDVVVISIKGTTAALFGVGGKTSARDKYNDNMMFSCCCAKVDRTWRPICECCEDSKEHQCSESCIQRNVNFADSYYNLALAISMAVEAMYPTSSIWFTGHSLGGALAGLLALTSHAPAFAFEAPGDLLFARRLGLLPPIPFDPATGHPRYDDFMQTLPIYHFGNEQDPIFLGACNGPKSSCYFSGYALESKCHIGKTCLYQREMLDRREGGKDDEGDEDGDKGGWWWWPPYPFSSFRSRSPSPSPSTTRGSPLLLDPTFRNTLGQETRLSLLYNTTLADDSTQSSSDRDLELEAMLQNDFEGDIFAMQRLDIRCHRMEYLIKSYLNKLDVVPKCEVEKGCADCGLWEWID
ncbi:putative lipase atg15 [Quaeritorhiza haematococci]|nr:putative lipase atg15 [Quaeritorhiza haematococci]